MLLHFMVIDASQPGELSVITACKNTAIGAFIATPKSKKFNKWFDQQTVCSDIKNTFHV